MNSPAKWFTEAQLIGYQAQVQRAIDVCKMDRKITPGAAVLLDLKTAERMIDIIKQARWTEHNHTA